MNNSNHRPPKLANWLLDRFCSPELIEDLMGDLKEEYYAHCQERSATYANWYYYREVISLIFSYVLKKRKRDAAWHPYANPFNHIAMLKNYFIVASRNLAKQKFFTIVNVLGLAIGMSISLLLIAVVADVYEYDKFHVHHDHIYRVNTRVADPIRVTEYASSPAPLSDILKEYPEVEAVVRMDKRLDGEVNYQSKFIPMRGFFTDPSFFKTFSFELLEGNPKTALDHPNNLLITASEAKKLFSDENPMGKTVSIGPMGDFIISGILKDHPKKSHLHFDLIGSYAKVPLLENQGVLERRTDYWDQFRDRYTYLQLNQAASLASLGSGLQRISEEKQALYPDATVTYHLQAMLDFNFGRTIYNSPGPIWELYPMMIFLVLSLLILLPACFNYANISIARSLSRAREIGVRKAIGSRKSQIFYQFLVEAVLVTLLSFAGAYLLFTYIREEFINVLAPGSAQGLTLQLTPTTVLFFLAFVVVAGLTIGLFPAWHFAKIKPLTALKQNVFISRSSKLSLRKALLVGQFTLSLGFIMTVVFFIDQYRYTLNYEMGFNQDNILNIDLQGVDHQLLETELLKVPEVERVAYSSQIIGASRAGKTWVMHEATQDSSEVFQQFVDQSYLSLHGINLLVGEAFPESATHDESVVIVNDKLVEKLLDGNQVDALNHTLKLSDEKEVRIIGITANFNYATLKDSIQPFFFRYQPEQFRYANVEIHTTDLFATMYKVREAWGQLSDRELSAKFLSDTIEEAYSWYWPLLKIVGFLGLLAISVSCLGLLGMVVLTVENRTKEVGIRKVHGASSGRILILLTKDYLKMMTIAVIIAVPVTYTLFSQMNPFILKYRPDISISSILLSISILLLLAGATLASQTLRAAATNPAETLKYE
ncbi:MAG: ABC transporter permease [Cyclobacteriaceae bacterium]